MANSIRASASAALPQDVETVFEYVASVSTMDDWVTGVDRTRHVSGDPGTEGAVYEYEYTYGGQTEPMRVEVTAVDRPHRIAMRALEGPFPFEGELTLESIPEGTRITNTIEPGADGTFTRVTFTLLRPVLRWLMRRRLASELDDLAAALASTGGEPDENSPGDVGAPSDESPTSDEGAPGDESEEFGASGAGTRHA